MAAEDASLLDKARARNVPHGPTCGVRIALDTHPLSQQIADLLQVTPHEITYTNASTVLKEAGIRLSYDTLSRHIRGQCVCAR